MKCLIFAEPRGSAIAIVFRISCMVIWAIKTPPPKQNKTRKISHCNGKGKRMGQGHL
jgi:hypothetical protein